MTKHIPKSFVSFVFFDCCCSSKNLLQKNVEKLFRLLIPRCHDSFLPSISQAEFIHSDVLKMKIELAINNFIVSHHARG